MVVILWCYLRIFPSPKPDMNPFDSSGLLSRLDCVTLQATLNFGKTSEFVELFQLLGVKIQLLKILPDNARIGRVNQSVNILADNYQIAVIVRSPKIFGNFMMTVNVSDFQRFPGYRALSILSAVQGNAVDIRPVRKPCNLRQKAL